MQNRPNKNKEESINYTNKNPVDCKQRLFYAKMKSDELCRVDNNFIMFGGGGSSFIWNKTKCADASKEVLDIIESCLNKTNFKK